MTKKIMFMLFLVMLALGERLWFDMGPNIELVTTAVVVAAMYSGVKAAVGVGFLIMFLSDLILGNSNIFWFTWSAFLIEAVVMGKVFMSIKKHKSINGIKRLGWGSAAGVGGSVFFYVWTNFGVWFLDNWAMYSRDFQGLLNCYINGLPFLKNSLKSSIVLVPFVLTGIEIVGYLRTIGLHWQKQKATKLRAFVAKTS